LWTQLEKEADKKVVARFPQLGNPPPYYKKPVLNTPYRLYKTIAPLHDNTIAFIGHVLITDYFRTAQAQAIWATAYLDNRLELPSLEERQKEVALFNAWSKRRYLNNGNTGIWMVFEFTGYTDGLLGQVGLSSHRRGWISDFFGPNKARDMRGIKDEYVRKFGCDSGVAKVIEGEFNAASLKVDQVR
jgi:dimethylaniline monooxygenase (N-oxide forming)